MRNKILIGVGIALLLFIILLLILCGGSGNNNTVTQKTCETLISGITADIEDEESKTYAIDKLTDNIQFNSEIENKAYTKLKINNISNFKTAGVVFLIKPEADCSIKFTLCKNE